MDKPTPTFEFYNFFEYVYNYYNKELYQGELPSCMFVIIRKKNTFGYFIPERWVNEQRTKSDEIAINPLLFGNFPLVEILQTVVHEMCHLWQHHFGEASQRTYHNQQWGDKMESIGLIPSNTGKPGGKKTGQQMMEYIAQDGPFEQKTKELLEDNIFKRLWYDRTMNTPTHFAQEELSEGPIEAVLTFESQLSSTIVDSLLTKPSPVRRPLPEASFEEMKKVKVKYHCEYCNTNVWGKADLRIRCNDCKENFIEVKK